MNSKINIDAKRLWLALTAFALSVCFIGAAQAEKREGPVKFTVSTPDSVSAGEEFDATVTFDIDSDWYIYAPTGNNASQGMVETKVTFKLPEGMETVGSLHTPEPMSSGSYEVFYGEDVKMIQTLKATDGLKAGKYNIKAKIRYQTCNPELCLPPMTRNISAVVEVK